MLGEGILFYVGDGTALGLPDEAMPIAMITMITSTIAASTPKQPQKPPLNPRITQRPA